MTRRTRTIGVTREKPGKKGRKDGVRGSGSLLPKADRVVLDRSLERPDAKASSAGVSSPRRSNSRILLLREMSSSGCPLAFLGCGFLVMRVPTWQLFTSGDQASA